MSTKPTILLDMDGVTVQCVEALLKLHDCEDRMATWPKGRYVIEEVCGVTTARFWQRVEEASPDIWINMKPYPYFDTLYQQLCLWGDVFFVSSPAWCAAAAQGKIIWLQDRFGKSFRNYVLTNQKHLLAHPNAILIDDSEKNCDAFKAAGGCPVLFPQPWNHGREGSWVAVLEAVQHEVMSLGKG